jgi:hypothetical protein
MESTETTTWGLIKVNQLDKKDQELAYQNHIEQFKERNTKPLIKEEFLSENVARCFKFAYSKEGHNFWFKKLNEISNKENRKNNYFKDKQLLFYNKDLVSFICYCIISFIIFFFALLFIFNN